MNISSFLGIKQLTVGFENLILEGSQMLKQMKYWVCMESKETGPHFHINIISVSVPSKDIKIPEASSKNDGI